MSSNPRFTSKDCVNEQRKFRETESADTGLMKHLRLVFDGEDGQSVSRAYEIATKRLETENPTVNPCPYGYSLQPFGSTWIVKPTPGAYVIREGRYVILDPIEKGEPSKESRRRKFPVSVDSLCDVDGDADLAETASPDDPTELDLSEQPVSAGEDVVEEDTGDDAPRFTPEEVMMRSAMQRVMPSSES
jgi:hypothetical protein